MKSLIIFSAREEESSALGMARTNASKPGPFSDGLTLRCIGTADVGRYSDKSIVSSRCCKADSLGARNGINDATEDKRGWNKGVAHGMAAADSICVIMGGIFVDGKPETDAECVGMTLRLVARDGKYHSEKTISCFDARFDAL